jgi:hypothetical protein
VSAETRAGLVGVAGIVAQQVAVILHLAAAAAGGHDDGLGAGFDRRPPGVDVAAHRLARRLDGAEMLTQRTATAGVRRSDQRHAQTVEHACGGGIDAGIDVGLHAAFQKQHAPGVRADGPRRHRSRLGHAAPQAIGQEGAHAAAKLQQPAEQAGREQETAQAFAAQLIGRRTRHMSLDPLPADVDQVAIFHAGRTGRLAVAAGQAAVEMPPGGLAGRAGLEHLLHEIDAPARAVQLVAEQLVGRAGGVAEAAMDAISQDAVGLAAGRGGG